VSLANWFEDHVYSSYLPVENIQSFSDLPYELDYVLISKEYFRSIFEIARIHKLIYKLEVRYGSDQFEQITTKWVKSIVQC